MIQEVNDRAGAPAVVRNLVVPHVWQREVDEVLSLCPLEPVDRLFRITDDADNGSALREPPDDLRLHGVRVLELVDEDVRESGAQELFG